VSTQISFDFYPRVVVSSPDPEVCANKKNGKGVKMQPSFKIGDKAVYPAHGVGEVMGIEHREIMGLKQDVYVLKILDNGMKIMIPTDKVGSVGLREVIPRKRVKDVYKVLKEKGVAIKSQTWNRRYREYMEKIKTGSIFDIAAVLRDLYLLKFDKDLSFGERKMLDTARNLLIKEISIAKNVKEKVVEKELEKIFN
jgi:CarD family transcriptional regulator